MNNKYNFRGKNISKQFDWQKSDVIYLLLSTYCLLKTPVGA